MPDHIRTKTAEEAEKEKWRLAPIGERAELSIEGEAICNVMGQHSRFLMQKYESLARRVHELEHKGRDE